ncbi:hypothetical protein [Blastococcus saxobsidens]|uniref:Uncharacterized protein n=1 Tax=Blastococcus saxobsidens TaxID=138336 RepID=A0A4Q7Y9W4_9ACTN|nr:hypothetical protein [Blastococcus saxobsidens]RZU33608.1 hypothetical protein BKA19_3340 [Blastococcus saxobsidens]
MSAPDQDRTPTTPAAPTVSTAPAGTDGTPDVSPAHRWWSNVPRHLGRARTSTVVLGVLFVAIFALWLNVRPPTDGSERPPSDPGNVEAPVVPGLPEETDPAPTEPAEPTTTAPRTTSSEPTTTPPTGTGSTTPTGTPEPTTGTTPSPPVDEPTDETAPGSPPG